MKDLLSLDLQGKKVLMRVDFNVAFNTDGSLLDDFRIIKVIPTIDFLLGKGVSQIILISHLGRPKLEDKNNPDFSLKRISEYLGEKMKRKVNFFSDDCEKETDILKEKISAIPSNSLCMLENIRFYLGEEENDQEFAQKLASLADIYINEAFSVSHREAASLCAITKFLPSYPGLLMLKEKENLDKIMLRQDHPFIFVLGGAKIKDKLPLLEKFANSADVVLLGGGVANTFLKAKDLEIGKSYYEPEMISVAKDYLQRFKNIVLPVDVKVKNIEGLTENKKSEFILETDNILDIGEATILDYNKIILSSLSLLFNGPMGKIEELYFRLGTEAVFKSIYENKKIYAILGGGETVSSLNLSGELLESENVFVSTGGGAMLSYLSGEKFPGLEALN